MRSNAWHIDGVHEAPKRLRGTTIGIISDDLHNNQVGQPSKPPFVQGANCCPAIAIWWLEACHMRDPALYLHLQRNVEQEGIGFQSFHGFDSLYLGRFIFVQTQLSSHGCVLRSELRHVLLVHISQLFSWWERLKV
jgi:hypothetical protein